MSGLERITTVHWQPIVSLLPVDCIFHLLAGVFLTGVKTIERCVVGSRGSEESFENPTVLFGQWNGAKARNKSQGFNLFGIVTWSKPVSLGIAGESIS